MFMLRLPFIFNNLIYEISQSPLVDISKKVLANFVSQLHDDEMEQVYFKQDRATAHSARTTKAMLREVFDKLIICLNTENLVILLLQISLWPYLPNTCQ